MKMAAAAVRAFAALWLACALALGAAQARTRAPHPSALPQVLVLAYHDVAPDGATPADDDTVDASTLARHFAWLELAGYTTVTLRELAAARRGERALPERAVLLMFDDGYASFYERVLPLLRAYGFRAVFAPVAGWLEAAGEPAEDDQSDEPGNRPVRAPLMTREQVAEAAADELVELASHSFALHHGIRIDAPGAVLPAASSPEFDPLTGRFETPEAFEARIRADLRASRRVLSALAPGAVNALVWPYGRASLAAERIAREEGFEFTFTLGDAPTAPAVPQQPLARKYITRSSNVADFAWYVHRTSLPAPRRQFVFVPEPGLDDAGFAARRDALVRATLAAGATQVVLLPGAPDALGQCRLDPRALASPQALARANHLAWHLTRRAGVELAVALPAPACLAREAWRALAVRLLEARVLDAAWLSCADAPAVAGADTPEEAQQWLRSRYPGLAVLAPPENAPCRVRTLAAEAPAQ